MLSFCSKLSASRRMPQLMVAVGQLAKNMPKRWQVSQAQLKLLQESIDEQFNRVDAFARRTGKVNRKDVEEIFKEIKLLVDKNASATSSQSLLLIRCCGSLLFEEHPSERNELVKEIFTMLNNSVKLDISHYNALLQVYLDNDFKFNPLEILSDIQGKGIEPNRVTYQRLIHHYCKIGDINGATKILEYMKTKNIPINEAVFNSLILGYGNANDLESAYGTLEIMKKSGLEPSGDTYTALLCAYASAKTPEEVGKIPSLIEEAKKNEIALTDRDFLEVIKTLILKNENSPLIEELISKVPKVLGYNQECMRTITELLYHKKFDIAFKLYETMKPSQAQVQQKTVGFVFIRALVKSRASPDSVIKLCENLKSRGYNDNGFSRAAEMALQMGDVENARIYLKELSKLSPLRSHYFWPILSRSKNDAELFRTLSEDMASMVTADYGTLHETFSDYVWPKITSDTDLFMEKCKSVGYSYVLTYNSLLDYCLKSKQIALCADLLSTAKYKTIRLMTRILINSLSESFVENPDIKNTIRTLREIIRNPERNAAFSADTLGSEQVDWTGRFLNSVFSLRPNDKQMIKSLLKEMEQSGLKISMATLDNIRRRFELSTEEQELLNSIASDKIRDVFVFDSEDFKPRKEMTIEELEENLIELKSKGMNTRGVLRSLLLAYCRQKRFSFDDQKDEISKNAQNRVEKIIEELQSQEFEFSNAMFSSLMGFYTDNNNIEEALKMLKKISDDFKIDAFKIINLAALLTKNDRIEEGINLIKEEVTKISKNAVAAENEEDADGGKIQRNYDRCINRFLNVIIEKTKDAKQVKDAFDLAIKYSNSIITALNAGPLIKIHLANEDFTGALNEYIRCANEYRVVPWKVELMRVFLEKADSANLQTVIDHSNTIHGEMNTIVDLATACIDVGKIKQAKKLLETPGLRIRQEKLEIICDKFIDDNKITELENFIQITKNMFDVDRDLMYLYLIKGYGRQKEANKALNVWTLMQEENLQPSNKTLRLLATILEENGITPPFAPPPLIPRSQRSEGSFGRTEPNNGEKGSFNQLNAALKRGDVEKAWEIRQNMDSKGELILLSQNCALIEMLLNADRVKDAFNLTQSLLQNGHFPSPRILRFILSKLATFGQLEMLDSMKPLLPDSIIQTAWFTSILANAYINAGKADDFLDNILPSLKPFPLGGILAILNDRPDLETKITKIANQLAQDEDYHLPQNMVWLHLMQNERYEDAKRLYDSNPKFKEFLLFTSLLDKIREKKNEVMAENLINILLDSNLTPKSIGIAYGALLDILVETKKIDEAENLVIEQLINNPKVRVDGETGKEVKVVDIEHVNRTPLFRLINAIREVKHREPKFSLPQKQTPPNSSSSSEDGSSSDEEALGLKQK